MALAAAAPAFPPSYSFPPVDGFRGQEEGGGREVKERKWGFYPLSHSLSFYRLVVYVLAFITVPLMPFISPAAR